MTETFSLWLMPDEKVGAVLQTEVDRLAQRFQGPTFEAHLTVLGGFQTTLEEAKLLTQELADQTPAVPLTLGEVGCSSTYFQCVLVRALSANAALLEMYQRAHKLFQTSESYVFMPHLSLFYGNQTMAERVAIAQTVPGLSGLEFVATRLVLVPTTPDPKDWQPLAEFELKK